MMNKKSTKRAFLMSMLSLLLCVSMFVGTTFAWFTDEVTSVNNVIQSGRLDAELYYGDSADAITKDASSGAIFDYDLWEPGYTQVRYVKIVNKGNLAFKFQLNIIPDVLPVAGEVNLADVIDVYMFDASATVSRETIAAATPVGTLSELMADTDGAAYGYLLPVEGSDDHYDLEAPRGEISYCIVLKMQETAGNEYQGLSVGNGFSVQLLANQYTWENDSFDHTYDDGADFAPKATVNSLGAQMVTATQGIGGATSEYALPFTTQFLPDKTYEEAQASQYRYWHADYVVKADKDVPANSVALLGYYDAWCQYNNDNWVAMINDGADIDANTEIRLVELLGATVNYEEICRYGNDPEDLLPADREGFICGATDLTGALAGTTITVELRLYEVPAKGECANGGGCNHPSTDCETEEYITIGTYAYTFGKGTLVGNDAQLEAAIKAGATDIELLDGTYHMPVVAQGKTLTISGSENAVIEVVPGGQSEANGQLDYSLDGSTVTFNGVTIKTNSQLYAGYARLSAVYNNCTIQNTYNLGVGTSEFNNCTFNITNEYLRVGGATSATFNGCTFNTDGRAILVFQDGTSVAQTVTVKNCTFNATAAAHTWNGIHVAAVSYDGSQGGTYTVNFEGNNVVDSDFNGLWQIKGGEANVTINGLN